MYKFCNFLLPNVFNEMFSFNRNIYQTRQTNKLTVPIGKTASVYKTLRYKGVNLWNELKEEIRVTASLHSFKSKVKMLLLHTEITI